MSQMSLLILLGYPPWVKTDDGFCREHLYLKLEMWLVRLELRAWSKQHSDGGISCSWSAYTEFDESEMWISIVTRWQVTHASNFYYSEMPPVSGGHCSFGEHIEVIWFVLCVNVITHQIRMLLHGRNNFFFRTMKFSICWEKEASPVYIDQGVWRPELKSPLKWYQRVC